MADETKEPAKTSPPASAAIQMPVQLVSIDGSEQPLLVNYASVNVAQGLAYLDFGFIEPAALALLGRAVQEKKALPKALKGRLRVRVALGLDVLQGFTQQLNQATGRLRPQRQAKS